MTDFLSPFPVLRFCDNNGNALSGGLLFTYIAGTTTKLATYTDSTGATSLPNPIVLNARGETANSLGASTGVWIPPGVAYKFTLAPAGDSDPPANAIWSVDGISTGVALVPYGVDTSVSANTITVSGVASIGALTAGATIFVKVANSTTGATTFNLNSFGATAVKDQNGAALVANSIVAGQVLAFTYDGTNWRINSALVSLNITAAPNISFTPVATTDVQGISSLATMVIAVSSASTTTPEYCLGLNMTAATGTTFSAANKKACLIAATLSNVGAYNTDAIRGVVQISASNTTCTGAIAGAFTIVNLNTDAQGVTTSYDGLLLRATGTQPSSRAIEVNQASSGIWHVGYSTDAGSCSDVAFYDQTSSVDGIRTNLVSHTAWGINLSSSTNASNQDILVSQQGKVACANGSGYQTTSYYNMLRPNGSGLLIGDSAITANFLPGHLRPFANATYDLGSGSFQWQGIYCVTLTQSSGELLKTDFAEPPSSVPFFKNLLIEEFRWKVQGHKEVEDWEEVKAHAQEQHKGTRVVTRLVDGVARQVTEEYTHHVGLYDEHPVLDDNGQPVVHYEPEQRVVDARGVETVIPAWSGPLVHREPRMEKTLRKTIKQVPQPGVKVQIGARAGNIAKAVAALGEADRAGYHTEAGNEGYQTDQIIWRSAKMIQELLDRVEHLEAKLGEVK